MNITPENGQKQLSLCWQGISLSIILEIFEYFLFQGQKPEA